MRTLTAGRCRRAVLALVAVTAACDSPVVRFPDTPPTAFHVNVSAWGYGSYDVQLRGDTLVSVRAPDFQPTDTVQTYRTAPTRADWQTFWSAARAAGLGSWPHECRSTSGMDGGGYSVQITFAGGQVDVSGVDAYPARGGICTTDGQTTAEYRTFTDAIATLIGRDFP